jgi:hypothetical protein
MIQARGTGAKRRAGGRRAIIDRADQPGFPVYIGLAFCKTEWMDDPFLQINAAGS